MIRNDSQSLLIIHPGGLGDVLLALPAMVSLRERFPAGQIVLLAGSEIGSLLQACGVVDRTLTTESGDLAALMGGADRVPARLRELFRRCGRVVGWLKDHDGSLRATLGELGIRRIVLETPAPRAGVHQSTRFLAVVEEACTGITPPVRLTVPEQLRQAGSAVLRTLGIEEAQEFILCHPGSGSVHKCVRPEIMAEVLRNFRQSGLRPVIVGGPADEAAIAGLVDLGLRDIPVLHHQSLATLAGILAQAGLFVGHDSGVTHLAGTLQIPTVAIFGPTDPLQWAPQGDHVSVVTGPPCTCSGWEAVRACATKACLVVRPEEILAVSFSAMRRYRTVTKS